MSINHREALLIHKAIHNPFAIGCFIAGKIWTITTCMGKERELREVFTIF